MGFQDREYLRDEPPPGMRLRTPQSMVITLVIINAAFFLVDMLFFSGRGPWQHALMLWMSCSAQTLMHPWLLWQLVTSGFAHSPTDIWHILINMFMLWSFGTAVEPRLGRWEFLRFYLAAIVFGSLIFCVRMLVMGENGYALGASGGVIAVTILFALQNPKSTVYFMLFIPMKAWVAALILVGVNVLGNYGVGREDIGYDVHLAGAAFALAYWRFNWNFGNLIPSRVGDALSGVKNVFRRKPKLRVHSPETSSDADERYAHDDAEADRILAKIDREGMNSLTARELKILEAYSRRMQQKHR